ncbi:TIGR01440 family protein [Bacillus solimangrovi]|uniref:UPF0340 protein BFG57_12325 n=1 Tax=Bacillus solimangrovi TaxID=1305675 RepID=A0A1E5LGY0_9BACI|nr:TIGR01440 family protein [Bacillus solimangrovi]OEH93306.1 TIGR01440 family protein [Bacillus solimangrovi]
MNVNIIDIEHGLRRVLDEFQEAAQLSPGNIFVIGCSTSEVAGQHIGTAGTIEIAERLFAVFQSFKEKTGIHLAFQCCEHLNRAIVLEKKVVLQRNLEPVSVIPVANAGGSMATYAYNNMEDAIVVESIQADAGIDIGDTLIGMHLKAVAVPIRSEVKEIGYAHITMAKTRPKLIGGERAVYRSTEGARNCT